ncbi:MAG: AmmeMemoRadiSam system radical SAM enzyme [Candidatus Cloacimonadales bacterium]|nr:AmmeMemoRadiSam system radical SAM enzyme [Candidatus Cloacimonadales bacterium]
MKKRDFLAALLFAFLLLAGTKTSELLREASFYTKLEKNYVRCNLCPNTCVLKDGETGICRVRQNLNGTLYTLVYNLPVSLNIDPIEKKPLFHFLPGSKVFSLATVGCNLNCNFCQNWTISQSSPNEVQTYEATPEQIVQMAKEYDCQSIAFTYTEPTVFYEYMFDIAKLAHENGIKTVWVTCGYINEAPLRKLAKYLDAANIDLKGFSEEFYETYTTGSLQPVLNTLEIAKEEGIYFEITNLVIPDANDDPVLIRAMCKWIYQNLGTDYPLHFSRFFPNYKLTNRPQTPFKTLQMAYEIALEESLKYVYVGNISGISEDTICPNCGKKLIVRSGYTVRENNIENGKCKFCGTSIPGFFSDEKK